MHNRAFQKFAVTCLISVLMAGTASAEESYTLKDALTAGITAHPEYGSAAYGKQATEEQLNQARSGFLPRIDLRGEAGYETSADTGARARKADGDITLRRTDVSLTLTQMLFDGLGTAASVDEQKARLTSSSHRLHATAELVGLAIVEAYLDVLRQRQLLLIAKKNVNEHEDILNLVQESTTAGRSTEADAEQVRARLAAARANEAATLQSLRNAEAEYQKAVGSLPSTLELPKLPLDGLEADIEQEVEKTLKNSPSLSAAKTDIDASGAQREAAKSNFFPQVDLQMNARSGNDIGGVQGYDSSATALVVMNWNLYRGGADIARAREASYRFEQSKQAHDNTMRSLENDVRQTWASMIAAGERAKQFSRQAQANEKVVSAYKDQFSLDRRTLLDVLDSQNELFVTRSNIVNTEFLEMFAIYRLMALKGNLLPSMNVAYPDEEKFASHDRKYNNTSRIEK